jgi:DegV family protein with EDD domain
MINIITDSTADIPNELLAKHRIEVIPMYIQLNGRVYHDGDTIYPDEMFEWVKTTGEYPTTSAPPPSDFLRYFNRKVPSIYIGVSGQLSTTIANAQVAIKELGNAKVDVIDSKSISIAYGKIVLQAAKWRDAGMGYEELGEQIRNLIMRSRGVFILNTLEYLYHGGRCSAVTHFASSLLRIRPFLQLLSNGSLGILKKVRGSREKAVHELFGYFKEEYNKYQLDHISIGYLDDEEEAIALKNMIQKLGYPKEILLSRIGCVLASHSGPKPIGIAYSIVEKTA